jgi:hypothetical protein
MAALRVNNQPNTQTISINKARSTPIGPTYNPQRPAAINLQPAINAQPASSKQIQGSGSSNYRGVTPAQLIAEAARQADIARIAAAEHKQMLHNLLEAKIGSKQKGIAASISRFVGLSGFTGQRSARERSMKYLNVNNSEVALYIQAKQREFERLKAERQSWLIKQQDNPNFNTLVDQANAWAKSQQDAVTKLAAQYGKTQKGLYQFAGSPIKGTASKLLGGGYNLINKNVLNPVSKVWNAFSWTASQPARVLNTAVNFVNPNRLRTYYGGTQKGGGIVGGSNFDQLKRAYNASANQRIIGNTKAQEALKLKDTKFSWHKSLYQNILHSKVGAKYADDVANLIADPINLLPVGWAAKVGKASRLGNLSSKLSRTMAESRFGRLGAKVGSSKVGNLSKFSLSASDGTTFKQFKAFQPLSKQLKKLDNKDSVLLQKYTLGKTFADSRFGATKKAVFSWDGVPEAATLNRFKRRQIEDLARQIKRHTDWLHGLDISNAGKVPWKIKQAQIAYKKGYLPQYKPKDLPQASEKLATSKTPWYFKAKQSQTLQTNAELRANLGFRTAGTIGARPKTLLDKLSNINRVSKPYRPLSLWRKSVLKYRPAWYVNNALWNVPAAVSAGGAKAIPEMIKSLRPSYRAKIADLTAPAKSAIATEIGKGKISRFGSAIENIPRQAAYKALLDKGVAPEKALKRVNDWLFDYSNKRFEQPIRTVLPFYNWSKGLSKLALKMPFTYPRHAGFYSKFYQQFYQQPLNQLDPTTKTWTDEKGQVHTSNERQKFEGKLKFWTDKNGKQHWANTPFYAMTPAQLGQINMNPLLVLGQLASSSHDRFGNLTTDKNLFHLGGQQIPQFNLGQKFASRGKASFERWFSKSGYSKESQGQDPKASNYNASADNKRNFNNTLSAFLGKPNTIIRDPKAAAYNKRYTDFNTAYFQVNWDKRINDLLAVDPTTAYDKWNAEKHALAGKYGFDFTKDIVHGGWQKYDTGTSKQTKALKEAAASFMADYWAAYAKLPKPQFVKTATGGYWTPSTARPFWIAKFKEWRIKDTFAKNPYYSLPYYNVKDTAGKKTGARSYVNPYELQQKQNQSDVRRAAGLARYNAGKAKYALWQQYFKLPAGKARQQFLRDHSELLAGKTRSSVTTFAGGRVKSSKQLRFEFFQKYFAASKAGRLKLMSDNPQFNSFGDPNKIGWDQFRANKTAAGRAKALRLTPNFSAMESRLLVDIRSKIATHNPTVRSKRVALKLR